MIIRPEVLPDEYAPGYKGRVLNFNGMTDRKLGMETLMAWSGNAGSSRREISTVELLAKIAGIDVTQFVCAHTTLPLRRAVAATLLDVEHGCTRQRSLLWCIALRDTRPGAYLCTQCVLEDLDFHGMSYWRREHQLPGQFCCAKHNLPLSFVESINSFLSPPSAFYKNPQVVDYLWAAKLQASKPINRFLAITSDLLARSKPLDEREVSRVARAKASALGLHTGRGTVKGKLISDFIKERLDKEWLASVAPGLVEKPAGELWLPVDGTLAGKRRGISATIYAIAFAVLYESSDEAINAMLTPSPPHDENASRGPLVHEVTEQRLRDTYVECRGCHAAVARLLQLSQSTIRMRLQEQGLPTLGTTASASFRKAAAAVFIDGVSPDHASKAYSVNRAELERLVIQSASPLRSALAAIRRAEQPRVMLPKAKSSAPPQQRRRIEPARLKLASGYYNELTPAQNVTQ